MPRATWRAVGGVVRGPSHKTSGQPCQDAACWDILPDGIFVAAVADGAGTAAFSDIGARLAATSAVEAMKRRLADEGPEQVGPAAEDTVWQQLLSSAVQDARNAVEAEAARRQISPRELASTLIIVVATPSLVAAAQVGDGAAVAADTAGQLTALTTPAVGEYLNETVFLISPGALEGLQTVVWRGAAANLAIFSDGLQMLALKMPAGTPHAPFFAPLFRFAAQTREQAAAQVELETFLQSPNVRQRSDDDVTLLLVARIAES